MVEISHQERAGDNKHTSLSRIFAVKESKNGSGFFVCFMLGCITVCLYADRKDQLVKEIDDRAESSIVGMIFE